MNQNNEDASLKLLDNPELYEEPAPKIDPRMNDIGEYPSSLIIVGYPIDPSPAKSERFTDEQIAEATRLLNYGQGLVKSELRKCAEIITQLQSDLKELDFHHNEVIKSHFEVNGAMIATKAENEQLQSDKKETLKHLNAVLKVSMEQAEDLKKAATDLASVKAECLPPLIDYQNIVLNPRSTCKELKNLPGIVKPKMSEMLQSLISKLQAES